MYDFNQPIKKLKISMKSSAVILVVSEELVNRRIRILLESGYIKCLKINYYQDHLPKLVEDNALVSHLCRGDSKNFEIRLILNGRFHPDSITFRNHYLFTV